MSNLKHQPLEELLHSVLEKAAGKKISIGEIFTLLKHQGLSIFVVIFSAPFLMPFDIPGLSFFLGIAILFLGLQIALPKRHIFPKRLLDTKISYSTLKKWIVRTQWILGKLNKVIFHRLSGLSHQAELIRFNGWCIFFLSLIFIIPIPVPFTNFLAAIPIFLIGLGLLEEDGLLILAAYLLGIICMILFTTIVWFAYQDALMLM